MLREALTGAGIDLDDDDQRIGDWLVRWEPSTVATICGWIDRAAGTAEDGAAHERPGIADQRGARHRPRHPHRGQERGRARVRRER